MSAGWHRQAKLWDVAQVYRRAGFPAFEAKLASRGPEWRKVANWITYQTAPRAMIFRRDEGAVRDLEGMMRQMRYNDYKHDPVRIGCVPAPFCHMCSCIRQLLAVAWCSMTFSRPGLRPNSWHALDGGQMLGVK